MSLTCGMCDQQIDLDDTAFHLGKCKMAREIAAILSHDAKRDGPISKTIRSITKPRDVLAGLIMDDYERNGPISHALERIIERALGKQGRLGYLLRLVRS